MRDKKFIREFTPNWFTIVMGTGGVSLVINQFSHMLGFLWWVAMPIWVVNVILFLVFLGLLTLRFLLYPKHLARMLLHSIQPLFLGCIAMGLVTIVDGFREFGVFILGQPIGIGFAICLWWISVVLGLLFSWVSLFCMAIIRQPSKPTIVALWLLPVVACEVAASSGALLIPDMNPLIKDFAFVLCIALWAFSVLLSLGMIALIFHQFITRHISAELLAPSAWLILGPIGNGIFGLMTLGYASQQLIIPSSMSTMHLALQLFPGAGLIGAIMLWGLGFWWLILAIIVSVRSAYMHLNFTLSWWTFTFPLAMYTLGTLK